MKFLIPTEPDDSHAAIVKIALEELGHDVRLLFTADQPSKQTNSVFLDMDRFQWKSADRYESVVDNDYDVVWWRRARRPYIPKDAVHPEDYTFTARENSLFYDSLTYTMGPQARWINPKEAATRANSKLLQLKVATQCGLNIPVTLCSNDPKDIRYFLLKHEHEGVIYKPLCSNFWFEEKSFKAAYTSKITFLELPENNLLQISPGIFQKEITKCFELRITYFGEYMVAAKLNSQQHPEGKTDWRAIPEGQMVIEPYQLPDDIEIKIRQFMRKMGLVFGCLDFIVTPEGNFYFLEVNEQGQFLWIEEYNPEFKMLDTFISFLLNKSNDFHWDPAYCQHSIDNYKLPLDDLINQNMQRHVNLNKFEVKRAGANG